MRKCTVEAQCLPACSRRVLLLITPALSSLSLLKEQTERSCLCSLSLCVLLVVDDPGDSVLSLSDDDDDDGLSDDAPGGGGSEEKAAASADLDLD